MNATSAYLDRMGRPLHPRQLKPRAIIPGRRDEDRSRGGRFQEWRTSGRDAGFASSLGASKLINDELLAVVKVIGLSDAW